MRPAPRATMPGTTARLQRKGPRRFTSITRHHSASSTSHDVPLRPEMPALLTSRSIGPRSASTRLTASPTAAGSITSSGTGSAPVCPCNSCSCSTERAAAATRESRRRELGRDHPADALARTRDQSNAGRCAHRAHATRNRRRDPVVRKRSARRTSQFGACLSVHDCAGLGRPAEPRHSALRNAYTTLCGVHTNARARWVAPAFRHGENRIAKRR